MGRKAKDINEETINLMIKEYENNNVSIDFLSKKYGYRVKRIRGIFKEKNVISYKKTNGNKDIIYSDIYKKKIEFLNSKNGYKYVLIDKDNNNNKLYSIAGNTIDSYLKKKGIVIPKIREQHLEMINTGNFWFEKYLFISFEKIENKKTHKCVYCEWETEDTENNTSSYMGHLLNKHGITFDDLIKDNPKEAIYFKKYKKIKERNKLFENEDNYVTCQICGEKFEKLTPEHLKKHNVKYEKYKEKYSIISNKVKTQLSTVQPKSILSFSNKRFKSKEETFICNFLRDNNINFKQSSRSLIGSEIDIIVENLKICIEYDGLYWHSEWKFGKTQYYHLSKTEKCNQLGYQLIHIFDDEFYTKKEIVMSKLKHILRIEENLPKIPARKCVVKQINKTDETNFLNEFHIQGVGQSTFSFGAFYNEKLIAVMTFKELIKGSSDYDLTRFASNINYICQGVGGKLLSYFVKNFNPKSIISFADRRWTDVNKNVYTKMGFKLVSILKPDYKYYNPKVDKYKRFHKFGFRKNTLMKKYGEEYNLNLNMTETEMVKILGYDRIWDCGLLKYKMVF